ncbi:hypothetical protein BLS_007298 [Venturia inaequalis]|uniref:Stress response protein NST1 n=1 Tax=Venturia inaequalis TaxID=5025 RepID=A0A8H3YNA1_VENIN|nr:hypothetical protein BLS_007298 [Venturia inaequalis]
MAAPPSVVRSSNGASPNGHPPDTSAGVNRKKAKRRAKEAAKRAAENGHPVSGSANVNNGHPSYSPPTSSNQSFAIQNTQLGPEYDDEYGSDQAVYDEGSEDGHVDYNSAYANHSHPNHGHDQTKKKRKSKIMPQPTYNHAPPHHHHHQQYPHSHIAPPPPPPPPAMSQAALRTVQKNQKDRIWNTSTQEERERIKDFWLSLKEDERKSLVKIEKEAVLRKMKEQQKHSCSCTVCGRKRTAIEEELEVLYDAYYEELEQPPLFKRDDQRASRQPPDHMALPPHAHRPPHGHVEELPDDEEEEEEEDDPDDEEYSEEEYDEDEEEYSDEEPDELPRPSADFFNFGNSLTVKGESIGRVEVEGQFSHALAGGILTVADDLLKNDGKKFIEMMEQLAERRMQREEDAQYAAATHPSSHNQQGYPDSYRHNHAHAPPPQEEEEEYDDEEDDEDYDSQDDYEEEEEDMDTMTEEQRMQEGRRMFQIFAARMFEQRVLTAYREKVAAERQQKLLEELEEEKGHDAAREAKKAKDAEKRKQKKQAQKQKQAEEKAKKDAEKAAQEAAIKEAETKRQEELKKKREEQRLKKEEQRKIQEVELARKNAEKLKRQKEEQDRRQETERKLREAKDAEKKAKEEAKKKDREEREAKERKLKAEKELKEREARERSERDAQARKEAHAAQQAHAVQQAAQAAKRAAAPVVPLPPGLHKQASNFGSPHVTVATPAIPKAPTPNVRPRQGSHQTSKGSSPKAPAVAIGQKANSPGNAAPTQNGPIPIAPRTILSRPSSQPPGIVPQQPMNHMHPIAPPPGMGMPQGPPFGMPPGMNGFHHQGPMLPGMRTPMQSLPHMFSPPQPPIGGQFRPFMPNGMPGPPPGMGGLGMPSFGQGPPGFPPQMGGGPPGFGGPIRDTMPAHSMPAQHSRNQSGSSTVDAPIGPPGAQAVQRPAPIQRPSSVKPHEQDRSGKADIDELSSHLGSSALLDDDESPEPLFQDRRPSMAPGLGRAPSNLTSAFGMPGIFTNINQPPMNGFGAPGSNPSSSWSTPSLTGFQQSNLSNTNGWGSSPTSGWPPSNGMPFGHSLPQTGRPRMSQIRISLCEACKALTIANKNSTDGFHDVRTVLNQSRERVAPPASEEEMLMLLDTLGTAQNGGGSFQQKTFGGKPLDMMVKWIPGGGETSTGSIGVGEIGSQIGSPLMGASNPGSANATPFGSLRNMPALSGLGTVP